MAANTPDHIRDFPSLTEEEFSRSCKHLCSKLKRTELNFELRDDDSGNSYIVIRKNIIDSSSLSISHGLGEDGGLDTENDREFLYDDDDDPECLSKPVPSEVAELEYHILLSPAHSLPVLYFNLTVNGLPTRLSRIYDILVSPSGHQRQIESIGVIGAISQNDHPILGVPYFFVHPCRTAETMMEWGVNGEVKLDTYLQTWLGIVGVCVGLHLPAEAFESQ